MLRSKAPDALFLCVYTPQQRPELKKHEKSS